jgi:hypothetical protein
MGRSARDDCHGTGAPGASDQHEGQHYADRFPRERGALLWCATCGGDCAAEALDWWQECPACVAWWRANPPPEARGVQTGR